MRPKSANMTVSITLKQLKNIKYNIIIDNLPKLKFNSKVAIITNPKVAGLHLKTLLANLEAKEIYIITVNDGESYKNMQTIESILDKCFDHKLDRKSVLIGFGGGVIGDMTGFTASIYQRGIEFIQIPTTLLSQVDASVGGKTGVNNRFGKNLIGAFHQPSAVYIDPLFLSTLDQREISAGIAEIIKMAVTFDKDFFVWLENNDLYILENLKIAISKSVALKAKVVSEDEKEKGIRAALNYGHTFGHVIEKQSGYGHYLHGEAVAIGMVMANALALDLGYLNIDECLRISNLLEKYKLPIKYNIQNKEAFYDTFFLDKKSENNTLVFIVPKSIGGVELKNDINKNIIMNMLERF
jgi:3-dehydroquinate synthase